MDAADLKRLRGQLSDARWRLSNLYYITVKPGGRIKFSPNWAQENLMNELHYCNVILKARQLGFSTVIQLYMLDQCVFNSNVRAGTIVHRLDEAKTLFRDKVQYPYDNLPEALRNVRPKMSDSAKSYCCRTTAAYMSARTAFWHAPVPSYLGLRQAMCAVRRQGKRS